VSSNSEKNGALLSAKFAAIRRASPVALVVWLRHACGSFLCSLWKLRKQDTDEWTERSLIATSDDIDEWTKKLLAELERVSTNKLAGEMEDFAAAPSAIERAIREHLDRIDPSLIRLYSMRAKSHFDNLVQQGDYYAETLRRAFLLLLAT